MHHRASKLAALLALVALQLLAGGCAVAEPTYYEEPTGANGTLTVQNDAAQSILRVRFSAETNPSWGDDQLGAAEVIGPGARRSWSVPADRYQVKIELADGSALDSLEVYEVSAYGEAVCRVTGGAGASAATGSITLTNSSMTASIHRVRIKPESDSGWGEDRLRSDETIALGGGRRTFPLALGLYNVRVEMADARSFDFPDDFAVTAGADLGCTIFDTPAGMGRLSVENGSGQAVLRVRIKLVSDSEWGTDRLGSDTIPDGATRSWDLAAGRYHVKIELADGRALDSLEEYVVPAGGQVSCAIWRQ